MNSKAVLDLFAIVFAHQAYMLGVLSLLLEPEDSERVAEVAKTWIGLAEACGKEGDEE